VVYPNFIVEPNKEIVKIGLAVIDGQQLLIVRESGEDIFILPGGRPEGAEDDFSTLQREIREELGCEISRSGFRYLGSFSDQAANDPTKFVTVKLYEGKLSGAVRPHSEIEEVRWFSPGEDDVKLLAPSIRNKILPFLIDRGLLA
jgi:8-oxo-dGTP diphosphatase